MALELLAGDRYGAFEIVEVLGTGAFARVYAVHDSSTDTRFALKLSVDPVTSTDAARRTLREVAILHSLSNPHVVRVHDAGLDRQSHAYILMELLAGSQLDVWHDFSRPLDPVAAVTVIHQACLGLAEAHAAGIVHRDLKPPNLWITPEGITKVLDFGLARAWDESTVIGASATIGHMLIGTPHYAQPEQAHTGRLTPASDVYSLGMILYEMLTARTPFHPARPLLETVEAMRDDPIGWLTAHVNTPVIPLRRYRSCSNLPTSLVSLVERCLAKDPAARPSHAGELANDLGAILHHDFAVANTALLRIIHPYGGHEERGLVPGSHRIGTGPQCELRLPPSPSLDEITAVLDWIGVPHRPEVRPVSSTRLRVGDVPVVGRTALEHGNVLHVADYRIEILLPGAGKA